MCGGRDKPCATCAFGGGGCLTAMYEDNYCPASILQVEKRLANGEYSNDKEVMEKYIVYKKAENEYLETINGKPLDSVPLVMEYCCMNIR